MPVASAARPAVATRPVVVERVLPDPNDVYISGAANSDVVFVAGSTYIWVTGQDGRRYRHFYGHGDRRREVFRRRDNLRSVGAPRPGHPTTRYAVREHGPQRENSGRVQLLHTRATLAHGHPEQKHPLALNNPSRHAVQPGHQAPTQNPGIHTASAGKASLHTQPEPRISAAKAEASPRS
ncbi:hypothetical protein [Paraburkholderia sp.]|uniref:hypothetical protein n=1 Tax=Paraburkholderia sp. TaxID=1926495 RepID=UPI002F3EA85B